MDLIITNESSGPEKNELSQNSRGGTELMLERLHSTVSPELLSKFQIIPSRVREVSKDRIPILWLHDLPNDPESAHLSDPESRARFKKLIFVSNWQMQYYNLSLGVPYSESFVLQNAIYPIEVQDKPYDGKVRLIYHTTPHRGLDILVPVFEKLAEKLDFIHLDVYSSFSIYGWKSRDEQYEDLFERCRVHPQITYHGAVSNEEVREALVKAHIFAYPCIWPETSCLAVIEAMSAKCAVVCPNFAALPETTAMWANMYQYRENTQQHAQEFANALYASIMITKKGLEENDSGFRAHYQFQKMYFDNFYSWPNRATQWEALLNSLL